MSTFGTFVAGDCNRAAVTAASELAAGQSSDPLWLYGASGHGKTHLLRALGHALPTTATIIPIDVFVRELQAALHRRRVDAFRHTYRQCGSLLIDDAQFMRHKQRTLEEFHHTCMGLWNDGVRIAITSDAPPAALAPVGQRDRGLPWRTVHLAAPSQQTRFELLLSKASQRALTLTPGLAWLLAGRISGAGYELEGLVCRIELLRQLHPGPLAVSWARVRLPEFFD